MKRLAIGVDMDETIQGLVYAVIQEYNKVYRQELNYWKVDQYDISPFLVPECKNIWKEFVTDDLIRNLEVEPTAVDTLTKLSEHHDIYFVTAGHSYTMGARDRWLAAHFPFYKSGMLIACKEKQLLRLDLLIDDYEKNLIGGKYHGLLINRPWNRKFDAEAHGIMRINFIEDVLKYVA